MVDKTRTQNRVLRIFLGQRSSRDNHPPGGAASEGYNKKILRSVFNGPASRDYFFMEVYGKILFLHPRWDSASQKHSFTLKTTLMISRRIINRLIILSFFVLIGYCLATSIAVRSGIGIFLAVVSLGAGVTFLYLLAKKQQEAEREESY